VDWVVAEAKTAGEGAALYLQGKLPRHEHLIKTNAGEGVGYVVPACIDFADAGEKLEFKFRCRKPMKDVFIFYRMGDEVLKKIYKPAIIPSEMEIDIIPKNLLKTDQGTITVSIEPRGGK
jgi:hypothetical protein